MPGHWPELYPWLRADTWSFSCWWLLSILKCVTGHSLILDFSDLCHYISLPYPWIQFLSFLPHSMLLTPWVPHIKTFYKGYLNDTQLGLLSFLPNSVTTISIRPCQIISMVSSIQLNVHVSPWENVPVIELSPKSWYNEVQWPIEQEAWVAMVALLFLCFLLFFSLLW